MPTNTPVQREVRKIRVAAWGGFLSAMGAVASICLTVVLWANGSALGTIVAVIAAFLFAGLAFFLFSTSNNKDRNPALQNRMARLRRARYRSAYRDR